MFRSLFSASRRALTETTGLTAHKKFINDVAKSIYFPGLPVEKVDIKRIAFYRRRPKGFTNGHYLMLDGARMRGPMYGTLIGYVLAISFLAGVACMHQWKSNGWFQFANPNAKPYESM